MSANAHMHRHDAADVIGLAGSAHGERRVLHFNVTQHPSAEWTLQQLREVAGFYPNYRYLIQDCDSIFARSLGESIKNLGLTVNRAQVASAQLEGKPPVRD